MDRDGITNITSEVTNGNLDFRFGIPKEVEDNRHILFEKLGIRERKLAEMDVQHEDKVAVVKEPGTYKVDALITDSPEIFLLLLTADCFPISLYDPKKKVIGLAHLGWKPTDLELIKKVVKTMEFSMGSNPAELFVHIGPGIQKLSYIKVCPSQRDDPNWKPYIEQLSETHFAIDLLNYNFDQLLDCGIKMENITINDSDTAKDPTYFSHYRAGLLEEPEGRMATILALNED